MSNLNKNNWLKYDIKNYKIDEEQMKKVDSKQIFFIESKLNVEKNLTAKQACRFVQIILKIYLMMFKFFVALNLQLE